MNVGERKRLRLRTWLLLGLLHGCGVAHAIDDPEAPDRVGAFERRAAPLEARLMATDGGSRAASAGRDYAKFLDMELNKAYAGLAARLEAGDREALRQSQREWLRFRDAEDRFIMQHWSAARVGSSGNLSAFDYRTAMVRQRVVQLLRYSADTR